MRWADQLNPIVEPNRANPFFESVKAGDGTIRTVEGALDTIMAGLACGVPNPLAWEIAREHCRFFFSCPDYIAAYGMRILGNPLPGDPSLLSGESGAVTCGLLNALCLDHRLVVPLQEMGLGNDSVVLLFNTEGDTDPQMYRKIVWDGAYPLPE
jgi:diaminopropionate ammonia-lyase